VNWQHFSTLLWLRWRLRVNQWQRAGTVNAVLMMLGYVAATALAIVLFTVLLAVGLFVMPRASPAVVLYVWDGLVVVFLFFWLIGLLIELQRSEVLSLDKFLHLPITLRGAFFLNYLSSLSGFSLLVFVPAMLGFSLGLVFAKGPALLWQLPLLAGFLLMVTALTYQLQTWLAALVANPRRRGTVIALVTAVIVLVMMLPNLLNVMQLGRGRVDRASRLYQEQEKLQRAWAEGRITPADYQQQQAELHRAFAYQERVLGEQMAQQVGEVIRFVNQVFPPGWLPLGAVAAAEGTVLPAVLGTLGLTLIGTVSLWRCYRTAVRLYTGQFTGGKARTVRAAPPPRRGEPRTDLLEWQLPGLSEQAAAIALSGFRSLTRGPEAKLLLLTPVLLVVVFGTMYFGGARELRELPESVPPLMAFGAMATIVLTMVQVVGNQFGFDRGGFRVFVLCAARRRDILLGKNLAVAPLALGLGAAAVVLIQVIAPMRVDLFLAAFLQLLALYLLFCLAANLLSLYAPMPLPAGSLKPRRPKAVPILLQLLFVVLTPVIVSPTLLPLGIEFVLRELGWVEGVPICLILSVLEGVAVVYVYRVVVGWQGRLLQDREQKILEVVTAKAE
jgi:hypothetical protein